MIAYVRGRVVQVALDRVVVEVGGLGINLVCPTGALMHLREGENVTVHTALVVREDSWTIYAFAGTEQRADFEVLQTVSGIGPRLALAMLATLSPAELRRAITAQDLVALTKVPGVGRKGAQRLVIELTGKLAAIDMESQSVESTRAVGWRGDVVAGLISLGWSSREAESAADAIEDEAAAMVADGAADVSVLLRLALRSLDRA